MYKNEYFKANVLSETKKVFHTKYTNKEEDIPKCQLLNVTIIRISNSVYYQILKMEDGTL